MVIGPQCDIQPMSFNVTKNHATISLKPKPKYTTGPQGEIEKYIFFFSSIEKFYNSLCVHYTRL